LFQELLAIHGEILLDSKRLMMLKVRKFRIIMLLNM